MTHPPAQSPLQLTYRPDIDGLRAMAVLMVVINHVGMGWAPGGFVGVDVFFVISGFLITRQILERKTGEGFGYKAFYIRRARRLLPALFVMMAATLAVGYVLLTPSDYSQLAASTLSGLGMSSNLFFWKATGGYFSPGASAFPLLHVWSLSVEEQFYLIWPILVLALARFRHGLFIAVVLGGLSFAWAQYGAAQGSQGAYFLLPARAGEFMIGGLLVLAPWPPGAKPNGPAASLAGLLGLALIAGSVVLLDEHAVFPGLLALAPCLGAALILAAPRIGPGLAGRLLSQPPLVGIGRISYSVYLWHWPLVSYLRLSRVTITPMIGLGVLVLSLALGAVSWRLLERDYRARLEAGSRAALIPGLIWSLGLAGFAALILQRSGLPGRFPFALLTQDQLVAERSRYWHDLPASSASLTLQDKGRRLLLVGNSHAYDLAWALQEAGFGGKIKLHESTNRCFNFGHDPVLPAASVECVLRWRELVNGAPLQAATVIYLHDNWAVYDPVKLDQALTELRARTPAPIVVFGPKMTFTDDVLAISKAAQSRRYVTASDINVFARSYYDADKIARDQGLKRHFATTAIPGVSYVSLMDRQCGQPPRCEILSRDGRYLYFDAGHLTLEGSRRLGARLKADNPGLF